MSLKATIKLLILQVLVFSFRDKTNGEQHYREAIRDFEAQIPTPGWFSTAGMAFKQAGSSVVAVIKWAGRGVGRAGASIGKAGVRTVKKWAVNVKGMSGVCLREFGSTRCAG